MMMRKHFSKTSILMMKSAGAICAGLLILGLAVIFYIYAFEKPLPFAVGMGMGLIHTIVKIITLEKSIQKTVDLEKNHAVIMARLLSAARFGITILIFVPVLLFPGIFGLFGTIAGVLSLQLCVYPTHFLLRNDTSV